MGMSGEATMAIATASTAAAMVRAASRARDRAVRARRDMPRARRIGNSAESRMSWRPSSWVMTASAMSPAMAAKAASANACGVIARSVAAN